jgi:RNA ligase
LKALEEDNKEGFVIKFRSDLRLKVKFEEYLRIHRIVTNVSNLSIWEALKTGVDLKEMMERVPDEFYDWVKKTVANFEDKFDEIEVICKIDFKILESRKETAVYFQTCRYPSVLFKMLDDKNYKEVIWKLLRPVYARPYFKNEIEN